MLFSPPVKDINLDLLKVYSRQLAEKIEQGEYIPDHVLFIERAGLLIGNEIAEYFNCPLSGIATKRSGGAAKSRIKVLLRFLPRFLTHLLRRIEIHSSVHEINSERKIVVEYPLPPKDKRIILVDDAIDTGHSIQAVLDYLLQQGYLRNQIKIAVMTTTGKHPICRADFSLFDEVICAFPWSYDSRQFDEAWRLYNSKRKSLCKTM